MDGVARGADRGGRRSGDAVLVMGVCSTLGGDGVMAKKIEWRNERRTLGDLLPWALYIIKTI